MESNFKNVSSEPSLQKYLQLKQILSDLINEEKKNFAGKQGQTPIYSRFRYFSSRHGFNRA